jgi:hypothetical protein
MTHSERREFQPGWATPVIVDFKNLSLVASLLGLLKGDASCAARRQGKCPGRDQCHDCAWSPQ